MSTFNGRINNDIVENSTSPTTDGQNAPPTKVLEQAAEQQLRIIAEPEVGGIL